MKGACFFNVTTFTSNPLFQVVKSFKGATPPLKAFGIFHS